MYKAATTLEGVHRPYLIDRDTDRDHHEGCNGECDGGIGLPKVLKAVRK